MSSFRDDNDTQTRLHHGGVDNGQPPNGQPPPPPLPPLDPQRQLLLAEPQPPPPAPPQPEDRQAMDEFNSAALVQYAPQFFDAEDVDGRVAREGEPCLSEEAYIDIKEVYEMIDSGNLPAVAKSVMQKIQHLDFDQFLEANHTQGMEEALRVAGEMAISKAYWRDKDGPDMTPKIRNAKAKSAYNGLDASIKSALSDSWRKSLNTKFKGMSVQLVNTSIKSHQVLVRKGKATIGDVQVLGAIFIRILNNEDSRREFCKKGILCGENVDKLITAIRKNYDCTGKWYHQFINKNRDDAAAPSVADTTTLPVGGRAFQQQQQFALQQQAAAGNGWFPSLATMSGFPYPAAGTVPVDSSVPLGGQQQSTPVHGGGPSFPTWAAMNAALGLGSLGPSVAVDYMAAAAAARAQLGAGLGPYHTQQQMVQYGQYGQPSVISQQQAFDQARAASAEGQLQEANRQHQARNQESNQHWEARLQQAEASRAREVEQAQANRVRELQQAEANRAREAEQAETNRAREAEYNQEVGQLRGRLAAAEARAAAAEAAAQPPAAAPPAPAAAPAVAPELLAEMRAIGSNVTSLQGNVQSLGNKVESGLGEVKTVVKREVRQSTMKDRRGRRLSTPPGVGPFDDNSYESPTLPSAREHFIFEHPDFRDEKENSQTTPPPTTVRFTDPASQHENEDFVTPPAKNSPDWSSPTPSPANHGASHKRQAKPKGTPVPNLRARLRGGPGAENDDDDDDALDEKAPRRAKPTGRGTPVPHFGGANASPPVKFGKKGAVQFDVKAVRGGYNDDEDEEEDEQHPPTATSFQSTPPPKAKPNPTCTATWTQSSDDGVMEVEIPQPKKKSSKAVLSSPVGAKSANFGGATAPSPAKFGEKVVSPGVAKRGIFGGLAASPPPGGLKKKPTFSFSAAGMGQGLKQQSVHRKSLAFGGAAASPPHPSSKAAPRKTVAFAFDAMDSPPPKSFGATTQRKSMLKPANGSGSSIGGGARAAIGLENRSLPPKNKKKVDWVSRNAPSPYDQQWADSATTGAPSAPSPQLKAAPSAATEEKPAATNNNGGGRRTTPFSFALQSPPQKKKVDLESRKACPQEKPAAANNNGRGGRTIPFSFAVQENRNWPPQKKESPKEPAPPLAKEPQKAAGGNKKVSVLGSIGGVKVPPKKALASSKQEESAQPDSTNKGPGAPSPFSDSDNNGQGQHSSKPAADPSAGVPVTVASKSTVASEPTAEALPGELLCQANVGKKVVFDKKQWTLLKVGKDGAFKIRFVPAAGKGNTACSNCTKNVNKAYDGNCCDKHKTGHDAICDAFKAGNLQFLP